MRRYKGIVGKDMYKFVYIHRDYINLAFPELTEFLAHFNHIKYNIVKLRKNRSEIFLVDCVDFDYADEPTVGTVTRINMKTGEIISTQKIDYLVYHHKWLWVADDYEGFDVQEAKERSERILKARLDSHPIGHIKYWQQMIALHNNFQ